MLSLFKETDRKFQETRKMFEEQAREAERRSQEADHKSQERDREYQEIRNIMREQARKADRQLEELGKQIGGLGDKFGYFTEGMALPSMERILTEQFGMTTIMPRVRTRKNGEEIEIDVLAYANDDINLAMVVEVKSRVKRAAIEQLCGIMKKFRGLYPEHGNKDLMAILAGVDWDRGLEQEAREAGFLTAAIRDEIFDLTVPPGFQARRWQSTNRVGLSCV